MMRLISAIILLMAAFWGCKKPAMDSQGTTTVKDTTTTQTGSQLTYLALGDSYTIGESVHANESYPYQLSSQLRSAGLSAADPRIIARTGWTTSDLKRAIADSAITTKFDFVTLLIGVNNQYQHLDTATYRTEFVQLLNTALSHANSNKKRVFVLSIPDYSVTPFAAGQDTAYIHRQIDVFNKINLQESVKAGVNYLDITPISREALNDPTLLAGDGLHPSGKMYMLWVQRLLPIVEANLK